MNFIGIKEKIKKKVNKLLSPIKYYGASSDSFRYYSNKNLPVTLFSENCYYIIYNRRIVKAKNALPINFKPSNNKGNVLLIGFFRVKKVELNFSFFESSISTVETNPSINLFKSSLPRRGASRVSLSAIAMRYYNQLGSRINSTKVKERGEIKTKTNSKPNIKKHNLKINLNTPELN